MDVVWKGIVGGLVTAAIVLASRRGNILPGILPLAPTFAIIALLAVGAKGAATGEPGAFRQTCLAGARTVPAYLVFLGVAWLLAGRIDYRLALLGALAAWLAAALAVFLGPRWL